MNEYNPKKCTQRKNVPSISRRIEVLSSLHSSTEIETTSFENNVSSHGKAVFDLLKNEQLYIEKLKELQKLLTHPLLRKDGTYLDDIVDLVEKLLNLHQTVQQALCDGPKNVAAILSDFLNYLNLYERYSFLIGLNFNSSEDFSDVCHEIKLPFCDLIREPIYQITRYKCLLENLSDSMPTENVYERALFSIRNLEEAISLESSLKRNMLKVLQIQKLLVKRQPKLLSQFRTLLKQGILYEVKCPGTKLKARAVFLFSDILLFCRLVAKNFDWTAKNSLKCFAILPLCTSSVCFVMGKKMLQVTWENCSYLFMCKVSEDTECWVQEVQKAIRMSQKSSADTKLNLKRKVQLKHRSSPFFKENRLSTAKIKTSTQNIPNDSGVMHSEETALKKFKKFLTCRFRTVH